MAVGSGTSEDPWLLATAPGSAKFTMYRDPDADPPALVCQVGATTLRYHLRAIEDLHAWLVEQGDWVDLGAADEKKDAAAGTVESWGRSSENPVGGWYGLRNGYRGRFGMYLPPLLEALGLVESPMSPATTASARCDRLLAGHRFSPCSATPRGGAYLSLAAPPCVHSSGGRGRYRTCRRAELRGEAFADLGGPVASGRAQVVLQTNDIARFLQPARRSVRRRGSVCDWTRT